MKIDKNPHPFFKYLWLITDNVKLQYRSSDNGKVKGKWKKVSRENKQVFKFFSGYFGLSSGFCFFNIILSRKITLGFLDLNFNFIQSLIFLIRAGIAVISSYEEPKKAIKENPDLLEGVNELARRTIRSFILSLFFFNTFNLNLLSLNFGDYIKIRVVPVIYNILVWLVSKVSNVINDGGSPCCIVFFKGHLPADYDGYFSSKIPVATWCSNAIYGRIWPSIEINIKGFLKK